MFLLEAIQSSLTDDLVYPLFKWSDHPYSGHCYIASEAYYHLYGKAIGAVPMQMNVYLPKTSPSDKNKVSHWFVKIDDVAIDLTAEQFPLPLDYTQAKVRAFLTKQPSKRALILMERVVDKLPYGTLKFLRSVQEHYHDSL